MASKGDEGFVRIRDHGEGIPPEKQAAVFDKYTRLQKTDQQNACTGLGLTISQYIMRLLDGRIELHNHPEGGAIFTLWYANKKALKALTDTKKPAPKDRLFHIQTSRGSKAIAGGLALRPVIMR